MKKMKKMKKKKELKEEDFHRYTRRLCRTLHFCELCGDDILCGQEYYDGGFNRRAHVGCAGLPEQKGN